MGGEIKCEFSFVGMGAFEGVSVGALRNGCYYPVSNNDEEEDVGAGTLILRSQVCLYPLLSKLRILFYQEHPLT